MSSNVAAVLPEEPLPVRFMNTLWSDRGQVHDDLANGATTATWFETVGLGRGNVSEAEAQAVRHLRDAVRTVAGVPTGDDRPTAGEPMGLDDAFKVIGSYLELAPRERLGIENGRVIRQRPITPASVADRMAMLALESADIVSDPQAQRLRACNGPRCSLFFVKDHPRREWCDGACGTRARAARHYAKRVGAHHDG